MNFVNPTKRALVTSESTPTEHMEVSGSSQGVEVQYQVMTSLPQLHLRLKMGEGKEGTRAERRHYTT